jgi:hypothetical protein
LICLLASAPLSPQNHYFVATTATFQAIRFITGDFFQPPINPPIADFE